MRLWSFRAFTVSLLLFALGVWLYVLIVVFHHSNENSLVTSKTFSTTTTTSTTLSTTTLPTTTITSTTSQFDNTFVPVITREIVDFYPGPSRFQKPRQINCSDILHRVSYVGDHAFARGFVKEVWLGELDGLRLIVKRPAASDSDGWRLFDEMMTKEIGLVRELRVSPFVMKFYGACRGVNLRQFQAIAVEGPLVNWAHAARSRLSWSARLLAAMSLMDVLTFLEHKLMAHCDWKADQVALDEQLGVKLVDLKSLRKYSVGHGVDRGKNCTTLRDCVVASACFKWQYENNYDVPELGCAKDGFCIGFLAPSMLRNSVETFLWPMLSQWVRDIDSRRIEAYESALEQVYEGILTAAPRDRWTAERVKRRLEALFEELDGAAHLGDGSRDRDVLRALVDGLTSSAKTRCESRFC
jgi:hypothetical protein